MYGFTKSIIPNPEATKKHIQRMEGFKEGEGKWVSEIYTEEVECFCQFSNGKSHVMTARYTEFRHNVKNPEDKTVIDWHWVDTPPYGDVVQFVKIIPTDVI